VDAYEKGIPIGILDGMSARELAEGRIGEASWSALTDARELAKAPIKVASIGSASMDDIEARVRRLARWGKAKGVEIGAVVVDYLGLIMRKQRGGQTDASAIAEITERMKRLAKSTRLAIICLAQLNRQCEQREDKRPRMSDLRDSGGIEQDADVVMFVYRDVVYNPDASPHEAEIIVAKQRNGRTGTAEVRWSGQSTEFYSEREQTHKLGGYEDFMKSGGL
jgi:replicative DNA helicase